MTERRVPSRRAFVGPTLIGLGGLAAAAEAQAATPSSPARPLRVVGVGAHPRTAVIARASCTSRAASGAYPANRSTKRRPYARRRPKEACRILGARPLFAGQIDGATELSGPRAAQFAAVLEAEKPDVVFAQWPIDTHPDHQEPRASRPARGLTDGGGGA